MDNQLTKCLILLFIVCAVQECNGFSVPEAESRLESQDELDELWQTSTILAHNRPRRSENTTLSGVLDELFIDQEDNIEEDLSPIETRQRQVPLTIHSSVSATTTEVLLTAKDKSTGKEEQTEKPLAKSDDEEYFEDIGWLPWTMLFIGLIALLVGLIICCWHQTRSLRRRKMAQFPIALTNPVYDQALRDLRSQDDLEINHGQDAFDYFSSGANSPRVDPEDPWKDVSLASTPSVATELDK